MKASALDAERLRACLRQNLDSGIGPFWEARAADRVHGGYLTNFDEQGNALPCPEKYLNTQCRLLWWFSRLYREYPQRRELLALAEHGRSFIARSFWDSQNGGWRWKVRSDGSVLDDAKIAYGQSFAIYAFSEHARATGDETSLRYAEETLACLNHHAADSKHGGYLENFAQDWSLAPPGPGGGDRKGLDTHMHLMESLTALCLASGKQQHRQELRDLIGLILERMIDPVSGCGLNQFDVSFRSLPSIAIDRTWNAERVGAGTLDPLDTTSYGHNLELAWLLHDAVDAVGLDFEPFLKPYRRLVDHALEHGLDSEHGGLYRDGLRDGPAVVLDKEFWQQAEGLLGFVDAYVTLGDTRYLQAAANIWRFVETHMVVEGLGEWLVLVERGGRPIDRSLGNPWKVSYHTGRALLESVRRLGAQ